MAACSSDSPDRRVWRARWSAGSGAIATSRRGERVEDAVRDEARVLDCSTAPAATIASTLDLTKLLQTVTDAATLLSGAEFGVFFYNAAREAADRLQPTPCRV